jgi:hypothetical protein
MSGMIDTDMLGTFALVGEAGKLAEDLIQRYTGIVDRLSIYSPFIPGERDPFWRELLRAFSK